MPVDRLIDQLDTLVSFLALSREDVFQILNEHRVTWFADNPKALPAAYVKYRKQVNHSALLLGYSYLENFLTELLASMLRNRPSMLPKDKKVKYSEILDRFIRDRPHFILIDRKRNLHALVLMRSSVADFVGCASVLCAACI